MELFVIRHTEVNNPDNLCYGKYEIPLKNNYKTKTKKIFQKLPNDFDKVYSSPSKRCTDLLKLTAKEFTEIKELHELDFGDWEGKKWDEINQTDLNFWMNDYVNKSPKNGEKMTDLYHRVIDFTENKLNFNLSKILFVTHSGVIRALLSKALNINLNKVFNIPIKHDEIYRFNININKKFQLIFLDMLNVESNKITKKLF